MGNNHGYNTPSEGATDWHIPLNDNFRRLDRDVELRDVESALSEYDPKSGAKFLATDTGRVFLGDGEEWIASGSITANGTADRASQTVYANQYNGASLTARVRAAIDDLPGGSGRVVVAPKADGTDWEWER